MNKVFAIGRLCSDPNLSSQNGVSILSFRLAADTRRTDKDGNKVTCFYRVTLWRRQAEVLASMLQKGDRVAVSGDFVPATYTDTNGMPRMSMDIENGDVEILTTKAEREARQHLPNGQHAPSYEQPQPQPTADGDEPPF